MITVKQITVQDTYPLRIEILRNGKAINYHFVGDKHKESIHLGAFLDNKCIGIVTLVPNSHATFPNVLTYQLRGMAVDKSLQKRGVGKLLIEESFRFLKEGRKCEILWCNARIIAVEFYKKMGFSIKGNKFQIPNVGPHYMMFTNCLK